MGPQLMTRQIGISFLWIFLICLVVILITTSYIQSINSKNIRPHNSYAHVVLTTKNKVAGEIHVNRSINKVQKHDTASDGKVLNGNSFYLMLKRVMSGGMLDPLNEYHVISNLLTPTITVDEAKRMNTSLCTHATTKNLHYLIDLSERWEAPISVAVFSYDLQIRTTLRQILYLHLCHTSIRNHVTFHLLMPRFNEKVITYESLKMDIECTPKGHIVNGSRSKNFQDTTHPYPANIMRTVAITHSNTDFIFMLDIDFLPSNGLEKSFQQMMKGDVNPNYDKTAFVIPAFEAKRSPTFAHTKSDIIREKKKGTIRVFYIGPCPSCQKATNYKRWLSIPSSSDAGIAYQVAYVTTWEPFYIAKKRNLPLYDGRFKQYGFDRISQVCETHLSGFQFVVMNNGFVVHDGFKSKKIHHTSMNMELQRNGKLYKEVKQGPLWP